MFKYSDFYTQREIFIERAATLNNLSSSFNSSKEPFTLQMCLIPFNDFYLDKKSYTTTNSQKKIFQTAFPNKWSQWKASGHVNANNLYPDRPWSQTATHENLHMIYLIATSSPFGENPSRFHDIVPISAQRDKRIHGSTDTVLFRIRLYVKNERRASSPQQDDLREQAPVRIWHVIANMQGPVSLLCPLQKVESKHSADALRTYAEIVLANSIYFAVYMHPIFFYHCLSECKYLYFIKQV